MRGETILVVDANLAAGERVRTHLEALGCDASAVCDVAAATAFLAARPSCSLVLAQALMPESSGFALLDIASQEYPGVGVILLASHHERHFVRRAFRRGAIDVLLAPIHSRQLEAAVWRGLEHGRVRRQAINYRRNLEDMVANRTQRLQTITSDLEQSYDITLEAMGDALDLRDAETEGHSKRVTAFTIALARALRLSAPDLKTIARGALLHDIGKIAIPDAILLKPGKLTDEEMEIMRTHCQVGYDMVRKIPFLTEASEIVYAHQEKYDGTGYPRGLQGKEIPLGARIFALADTLDAMTSDRPYRNGMSFGHALSEIERCAGTQFDPAIVDSFMAMPRETWSVIRAGVGRHSHAGELVRAAAA